jgi:4-amino-4-deoxy-L-arabinose transferase-like glycosyltransferase
MVYNQLTVHPDLNTSKRVFYLFLIFLSLLGMLFLWRSTPYGLGLVNDSAFYLEGAHNLLAGEGYVRTSGGGEIKPITHFPPLYSLLLAGVSLTGLELLVAARLLALILFGITIFLTGLSVYQLSRSLIFALLGALLLATSDVFLGVYSMALSEALFLALLLAAFLALSRGLERASLGWLAGAGLLLSLATLTRYAGASLYLTAILALLLVGWAGKTLRWKALGVQLGALLAGGIPLLLAWGIASRLGSGTSAAADAVGNRLVSWHPPALTVLFEAAKNLLTWLAPDDLLGIAPFFGRLLSLASLLLLPGLLAWLVWRIWPRRAPAASTPALAWLLALHVPVYLGLLVVSLTLFDASTPLNARILTPAYLALLGLFAAGLGWAWRWLIHRRPRWRWAVALLALLAVAFSLLDGLAAVRELGKDGQGFAHSGWQRSPAIQAVRGLPPLILYSNKPTAIYLLTGRSAYITPTPSDAVTTLERDNFTADLIEMQRRVLDGQAVVVLFGLRHSADAEETALYDALSAGLPVLADFGGDVLLGKLP